MQAKAASAKIAAEEDNQAPNTAASPHSGGTDFDKQQAAVNNEQLEGLPFSTAHGEGQAPGPDGQAERQPSDAERQADRQPQGNALADQEGSRSEDSELEAAHGVWQVFQDILPVQRYWWKKLHFR